MNIRKIIILLLFPCCCFAATSTEYPIKGTLLPYATTKIGPQISGRVLAILADVGQKVEKGEVLLKIDPAFWEIDMQKKTNQYQLAELVHAKAVNEFTKRKELWENRPPSISKQEFEEAEFLMKQASISLEQARLELETARLQYEETFIRAPYSGVISKRYADTGDLVIPHAGILFEVMDLSKLWLEFSLPQDLQAQVDVGQELVINDTCFAKIEKILPSVDITSRCFACRVLINNQNGAFMPGMFLTGKLKFKNLD